MLDNVKNMISDKVAEFLALKCDFWILVVLALVMLIIFIVLLKSRLRLDYKFTEAESAAKEEIDGIRTRAEREISEAKKAAAWAMSSGVPSRPRGVCSASASRVSCPRTCTMSVLMTPGAMQLTRMWEGASSSARERVRAMRAALVQQ